MINNAQPYNDFAFILSWPDATIRGDEKWMMFFKKIGIVKNLNFKVGHTGIVIVSATSGELLYYDFGRYISPRGYGRARSKDSDPLLEIKFKATFKDNNVSNIEAIVAHFETMKPAMQGNGELYFSIVKRINFGQAKSFADKWVYKGSYPYGAVAKGNNNCSRFITRLLFASSAHFRWTHPINFPETIKVSPISNVINSAENKMIYSYSPQHGLQNFKMSRMQSLLFLIKKLSENVYHKQAALLPEDISIGGMVQKHKPSHIPESSQYLGGVGEGAWFDLSLLKNNQLLIQRFTITGFFEYAVIGEPEETLHPTAGINITYDSHLLVTHIIQNNKKIKVCHLQHISVEDLKSLLTSEMIA
ncbi:hypothetical protein LZQ00_17510 [Sphingobacterium sp. SRCM116780]|uniref:DUF6695 family protein n=1 Tax=Sphingobacterium sp. SRCM116780 TaxID=2907623 RepID=UPI001F2D8862|nr:DUF6695 family protein [Sphingobacterium sp. SRCM116780]UIR56049.1 hypothetical protein LZQ00_17510 [Sphingobacterium sp. SRCM116780]